VFCNRGRNEIKILCWERKGPIVFYTRLKKQCFRWPKSGETLEPTGQESNWLLDGFGIFNSRPHIPLHVDSVD